MNIKRSKINTSHGCIAVYEAGSGEPLVFLGGYSQPFALADYYNILEGLSEKYRVLLIDLMGYGNSEIAIEKWGFSKNLGVLDEVTAALALDKFSIIGHSLGGNYALCYTMKNPERVNVIILLDTYPYMTSLLLFINRILFYFIKRTVKKAKQGGGITYEQIAEKMGYPVEVKKHIPAEMIAELEELANTKFLNQNVVDELSDVSKTIKIAFGKKSVNTPCLAFCRSLTVGSIKKLKRLHFPETKIVYFWKTSHNIHVDNLNEVMENILEFTA